LLGSEEWRYDVPKPKQKKAAEKKEETPKAESSEPEPKSEISERVVYVGQKPVKNYVIACLTSFSTGSNKIVLKARGRAICKAVDTVELLRRTFMKDAQLQGISICTEQVTREGDKKANVSSIEITLTKP
jgi:DNA-binding protein